jgi:6-phosphogluconolactonase
VGPARAPKPPERCLTITPALIAAARRVLVLAAGADKAGPVARALKGAGTADEVPARLARDGIWFLDQAAARLLAD